MTTTKPVSLFDMFLLCYRNTILKLFRFLNTDIRVLKRRYRQYRRATNPMPVETTRYFVSARNRFGLHGYGRYTSYPVVILNTQYNIEIEDLMNDRVDKEPLFLMGSREEIMDYVKGLKHSDFDNAKDMDYYRVDQIKRYIRKRLNENDNLQHIFRNWLQVQVDKNIITKIDGYVFKNKQQYINTPTLIGFIEGSDQVNCTVGDFLYKYYASFKLAQGVIDCPEYYSVDQLARELMIAIDEYNMGVSPHNDIVDVFFPINSKIRDAMPEEAYTKTKFTVVGTEAFVQRKESAS